VKKTRSVKNIIIIIIFLPGITSYFDPGFDVQASREQLLNVALTIVIGLFAISVIIPVRTLTISNINDYIYGLGLKDPMTPLTLYIFDLTIDCWQDSWIEITNFANISWGEVNQ